MLSEAELSFGRESKLASASHPIEGETRSIRRKIGFIACVPEVLWTASLSLSTTVVLLSFAPAMGLPDWSGFAAGSLGVFLTTVLFFVAMQDPELNEWAVCEELSERFGFQELRNEDVRRHVLQIIRDRGRLERHVATLRNKSKKAAGLVSALDYWLWSLKKLVSTIDPVSMELSNFPGRKATLLDRIAELESRAAKASASFVKQQLQETIAARKLQIRSMEELESQVELGHLKLERAVSVFATVDAKLAMLGTGEHGFEDSEFARLSIKEEIDEIDVVVAAMKRVYLGLK